MIIQMDFLGGKNLGDLDYYNKKEEMTIYSRARDLANEKLTSSTDFITPSVSETCANVTSNTETRKTDLNLYGMTT